MAKEKYLHDAIKTIVNSYGKKLYYDKRMINYISDYYSFDPLALYNVMKTLIADGYAGQLIDASQNGDWKIYVTQSIAKVQKNYGFAPIYVNYCFQSLAYGIGCAAVGSHQHFVGEAHAFLPADSFWHSMIKC